MAVVGKTHLYNAGDEVIALTGGWINATAIAANGTATETKNATNLYLKTTTTATSASQAAGYHSPTNMIDLTNFTKLKMLYSTALNLSAIGGGGRQSINIYITTNADRSTGMSAAAVKELDTTGNITVTDGISEVDVTALNSSYYIGLYSTSYASIGSAESTIYKVWLE